MLKRRRRNGKELSPGNVASAEREVTPELQKARDVVAHIRRRSKEGLLVDRESLGEEPGPVLALVQQESDIKAIHGRKASYLFSEESMSHSFAKLSVRLLENDLVTMLAEQVRNDSKLYPRPSPARQFYGSPFNIEKEQLVELLTTLYKEKEYSDIESFETTNGALYLYSKDSLHPDQARAIAQMQEVEEPELFF